VTDLKYEVSPIGHIETPFTDVSEGVPIQGRSRPDIPGRIVLKDEYIPALEGLEEFSHIICIYLFHRCREVKLRARPYADPTERGILSIRSPHRPNHIGITLVELAGIERSILHIKGVDMLDGTPLLDIKPYNPDMDYVPDARIGWMGRLGKNNPFDRTVTSHEEWLHENTEDSEKEKSDE
jgi:tRNA-Thr(GGU) m(6)t(6)A37 methyltransferase TsaA